MRRRAVSSEELKDFRDELEATYTLRSYEIDAGPKVLRIAGPSKWSASLDSATEKSTAARMALDCGVACKIGG